MQYVIYRFGKELWLVPRDLVSTEFTSAYNVLVNTKTGQPETLTEEQSKAFMDLMDNDEVRSINSPA